MTSAQAGQKRLLNRMAATARQLADEWADREFGDAAAQAAVCAVPILAAAGESAARAIPWLMEQLAPWERFALDHADELSAQYQVLDNRLQDAAHLYDAFLHRYSRGSRKQHGVFFTPRPIADYIICQIDATLRSDFDLPDGLAQSNIQNPKSKILLLDPACGTGVFQLAILDFLHARRSHDWNDIVPDLLPRLIGIELLPAAAFLAKLNIALKLAETGYHFAQPDQIQIHCGNALDPNLKSEIRNLKSALPVILGNPPFSSLSTNTNDWIAGLVRGDEQTRGYVRAGEQRLGERKTWLHDDYVKFIRLAQWYVEQAGRGVVGLVTNRGYLDNTTFRLMRHELLRVFPRMSILDLHGSRKAHEVAPGGSPDENVFGLDQGVAIGVFSRLPTLARSVEYRELWGTREAKLAALAEMASGRPGTTKWAPPDGFPSCNPVILAENYREADASRSPAARDFCFATVPNATSYPDYDRAWSLADAMPLNASAPVTARDHFVVAFNADDLRERIAEFRDLTIPDDVIRAKYFQRTRSARYERGDTRSWKLAAARAAVAADPDWQSKIVRCLYRPFDWRFVFWHPAMIDWPRNEVTRHVVGNSEFRIQNSEAGYLDAAFRILNSEFANVCLIARRQQLPTQPCTFFWIADGLALDGVIRSDNRGSESLFPLYVREDSAWRANFAAKFVAEATQAAEMSWIPLGRGDLEHTFGPEDLLAMIYALFHSPTYRERYSAALRTGFPRVILPSGGEPFRRLALAGHELIDLHLLRSTSECRGGHSLQPAVAAFRAGGYVALQKWLQPSHRSAEDRQYQQIAAAIARTLELMKWIG